MPHHNTSTASNQISRYAKDDDEITINYGGYTTKDNAIERNKRDRIKQLGAPHMIMQDRLNSMNPLTFGDTIRLPVLMNLSEANGLLPNSDYK
jgi:hypothetical protein